jgi:hypothetical protein
MIMRITAFLFFFGIFIYPACAQKITATTPAKLQVFISKPDGNQVVMNSDNLSVTYDQLKMTGELLLNSLVTDDGTIKGLIDSAYFDRISFSGTIPEEQFAFQSMLNAKFSVETDVYYGDQQSRILFDFDVSNRNTSLANSFSITCSGSLSLADDLGITRDLGIGDQVSFQFIQNVQTKSY